MARLEHATVELTTACVDLDALQALAAGLVTETESEEIHRHCASCSACADLLSLAGTTGGASAGSATPRRAVSWPSGGSRFLLEGWIGGGGMGSVFRAFDTQLGRYVAVKLLTAPSAGSPGSTAQRSLLEEARALATVCHPNVVPIYDVGEIDGDLFIAMELVDGVTIQQWVEHRRPIAPEVVSVFVGAAAGLQAVHDAGMVHGDFKPSNVLVTSSERALVVDFGLSKATAAAEGRERSGLAGTPLYMAPEQLAGASASASSDQFAFCVSLYQALTGCLPFEGSSAVELLSSRSAGRLLRPSRRDVPGWLWTALARGLSPSPAARWPSMAALVDQLRRGPGRARLKAVAAGAAVAAGLGSLADAFDAAPERSCVDRASVGQAWGEARRRALVRAVESADLAYATDVAQRLPAMLDSYVARFSTARSVACHRIVASGRDVRDSSQNRCLNRRRRELEALLDLLEAADERMIEVALDAVTAMPDPMLCADASEGWTGAEGSDEIEVTLELLALAKAHRWGGRAAESEKLGRRAIARASEVGHDGLLAQALLEFGRSIERSRPRESIESFQQAHYLAVAAGIDGVATRSAALTVSTLLRLDRVEEASAWVRFGLTCANRTHDVEARIAMSSARVAVLKARGFSQQALNLATTNIEAAEGAFGPSNPVYANMLHNWALAQQDAGRYEEARAAMQRSVELDRARYGPLHPARINSLLTLARMPGLDKRQSRAALGEVDTIAARVKLDPLTTSQILDVHSILEDDPIAATRFAARSLEVAEEALGRKSPRLVGPLNNLALAYRDLGRLDEALSLQRRALSISRSTNGRDAKLNVRLLDVLAKIHVDRGEMKHAFQAVEEATVVVSHIVGPDHADVANFLTYLAKLRRYAGDLDEAVLLHDRALRHLGSARAATDEHWLDATIELAHTQVASGDRSAAVASLERAVGILIEDPSEPSFGHGQARFELAQLLHDDGASRARGCALAREATTLLPTGSTLRAEVEAWLATQSGDSDRTGRRTG